MLNEYIDRTSLDLGNIIVVKEKIKFIRERGEMIIWPH